MLVEADRIALMLAISFFFETLGLTRSTASPGRRSRLVRTRFADLSDLAEPTAAPS
ncbi:MAG: hypothetical protein IPM22_20760 [Betaproteobacteria bacterium]|nr:hypothetical protein [Betaproteobacteria bacterium]